MWNKELPTILPKGQFGRLEPFAMQWEKLMCDVRQFVIPFNQWTSTLARRHIVKVRLPASCARPLSSNWWPRLLRCDLGSKKNWRLASCSVHGGIGKSSKATLSLWFIRRIVSDQSSPFTRTQPTIDRNILRCSTLMFSNCTFVSANVCKLKSIAGVTTALRNFKRNFKLTCLFVSMVRCLLNCVQAIVLRWCNSTQPRCFRLPGCVCQDTCGKTPHEEHAPNPATLQHTLGNPTFQIWAINQNDMSSIQQQEFPNVIHTECFANFWQGHAHHVQFDQHHSLQLGVVCHHHSLLHSFCYHKDVPCRIRIPCQTWSPSLLLARWKAHCWQHSNR